MLIRIRIGNERLTPRLCFSSPRLSELTYNVVYPPYSVFSLTACYSCQILFCDLCSVPNNTTMPISKTDLRGPLGGSHCQVRGGAEDHEFPSRHRWAQQRASRPPAQAPFVSRLEGVRLLFTIFASQITHQSHSHSVEFKKSYWAID